MAHHGVHRCHVTDSYWLPA
ncbi:hypothetical protein YPPY103_1562, partial [Yersinia pestis PY-103]